MSVKCFEVSSAKHLKDAFYEHRKERPAVLGSKVHGEGRGIIQ